MLCRNIVVAWGLIKNILAEAFCSEFRFDSYSFACIEQTAEGGLGGAVGTHPLFSLPKSFFLLHARKAVLLASCNNVEMLVILCFLEVTCKNHMRRFEAII